MIEKYLWILLFIPFCFINDTAGQKWCEPDGLLKKLTAKSALKPDKLAVVFLNDECPVCMHYASEISFLDSVGRTFGIPLIGVFSGGYKKNNIKKFIKKYNINIPVYQDKGTGYAQLLGAGVTPEIFITDCKSGQVLYKGLIDDSFAGLGIKKSKITEHYFLNAVRAVSAGNVDYLAETRAIGCMIQLKK